MPCLPSESMTLKYFLPKRSISYFIFKQRKHFLRSLVVVSSLLLSSKSNAQLFPLVSRKVSSENFVTSADQQFNDIKHFEEDTETNDEAPGYLRKIIKQQSLELNTGHHDNIRRNQENSIPSESNGTSIPSENNGTSIPSENNGTSIPSENNGISIPSKNNGTFMEPASILFSNRSMEPTSIPPSDRSIYPTNVPTRRPTDKESESRTQRPTFEKKSEVIGTYIWNLQGPCCNSGEKVGDNDVGIIRYTIQKKAMAYVSIESGGDHVIKAEILENISQDVFKLPPSVSFQVNVKFSSSSVNVNGSVKGPVNSTDFVEGFQEWFAQETSMFEEMNENYFDTDNYFQAGSYPFTLRNKQTIDTSTGTTGPKSSRARTIGIAVGVLMIVFSIVMAIKIWI